MDQRRQASDLGALVKDLKKPRPVTYWTDLAVCLTLAGFGLFLSWPFPDAVLRASPLAIFGLLLAAFALFRATYFNHELAHHARELPGFEIAWNLTIGIPLLIPSFLYSDHLNHHSLKGFATESDVEYFPPKLRGMHGAVLLVIVSFLLPLIYGFRFLVIAPIAWCSPTVRRWADMRASSLGILGLSKRRPPMASELFSWRIQEVGCFAYIVLVLGALASGLLPLNFAMQFNTVILILLFLHAIRIMVGHRYETDSSNDRIGQVLDSFNFTGNRWVAVLMAPLGFHLHALHHLFPQIPYHNMQEAHRRVSAALPAGSFYHSVETPSYFRAVAAFMMRGLPAPRRTSPTDDAVTGRVADLR